jgi:hypothetical protein
MGAIKNSERMMRDHEYDEAFEQGVSCGRHMAEAGLLPLLCIARRLLRLGPVSPAYLLYRELHLDTALRGLDEVIVRAESRMAAT